jgi:hypothetical protein
VKAQTTPRWGQCSSSLGHTLRWAPYMPHGIQQQEVQRILWIDRGETVRHQQKQGLEVDFTWLCPAMPQDWTLERRKRQFSTRIR